MKIQLIENKPVARSMASVSKYVEIGLSERWVLPGAVRVAGLFGRLLIAAAGREQRFYDEGPRFHLPCNPLLLIFSVAALPSAFLARAVEQRQSEPFSLSAR